MKCQNQDCKKNVDIIVGDCNYCKKNFCQKHRLPEDHSCQNLEDCRKSAFTKNSNKLTQERCVSNKNNNI